MRDRNENMKNYWWKKQVEVKTDIFIIPKLPDGFLFGFQI